MGEAAQAIRAGCTLHCVQCVGNSNRQCNANSGDEIRRKFEKKIVQFAPKEGLRESQSHIAHSITESQIKGNAKNFIR